MKNVKISFSYIFPNVLPSITVAITATYDINREGDICNINVLNIAYIKPGEMLGANIDTLLKAISPAIYNSIIEEVKHKATVLVTYKGVEKYSV